MSAFGDSTAVAVERVGVGVVLRPVFDPVARSFDSLTDADWERAFEQPFRATVTAMQAAYRSGLRRIVVVVPVTAMSGGARYGHVAAPSEALRVLVKSAARQWGAQGVTVNAVAVSPDAVLDDAAAAGPVAIAPAALGAADPAAVIAFLCSEDGGDLTGQTITVDGGLWM